MDDSDCWNQQVSSLLSLSIHSLMKCLPPYIDDIFILPPTLKDRIIKLMAKRGCIDDDNIHKVVTKSLKVLDLSECEVSDSGLLKLSNCQGIRKIDLNSAKSSRNNITSAGVIHLARLCPMLEVVYLRRCTSLTDEGVEMLAANCRQLRELNIGGNPLLTDKSLDALGQYCRNIGSLDISKANVTDEGILNFVMGCGAGSMKELHINGCVNLTDESVDAIIQCCPKMNILIFHGCPKITERSRMALEEMMANTKVRQLTWTVY